MDELDRPDPSERPIAFELQRMFYNERALAVGSTCKQVHEYDLAVKAYKTAIDNEIPQLPISFKSLYSLANSCHQLRKNMEAVHFYGMAVARICRRPTAYRCSISVAGSSV
jgi:hypothetical protein